MAYIDPFVHSASPAREQRVLAEIGAMERQGIKVHLLPGNEFLGRRWRRFSDGSGLTARVTRLVAWGTGLTQFLSHANPDLVLVLGTDPRFLSPAVRWCHSNRVPVINEVLDLYQFRDGDNLGARVFNLLTDRWGFQRLSPKCSGAILATTWLAEPYRAAQIPSMVLPALISGAERAQDTTARLEGTHIGYASTPLRSDTATIQNVIELARRSEIPKDVTIHMIGSIPRALRTLQSETSSPQVIWHGLVPRSDALTLLSRCTFTLLQRPPSARWAVAGFPSKVAESLLLGRPLIANLFGDMSLYLRDGENSLVIADEGADALAEGLRRAVSWMASENRPDPEAIADEACLQFSPEARGPDLVGFLRSVARSHSVSASQ